MCDPTNVIQRNKEYLRGCRLKCSSIVELQLIEEKEKFTTSDIKTMMVLSKLRTWGGHGDQLEDNNNTIKRDIHQSALSAHTRCTYSPW